MYQMCYLTVLSHTSSILHKQILTKLTDFTIQLIKNTIGYKQTSVPIKKNVYFSFRM